MASRVILFDAHGTLSDTAPLAVRSSAAGDLVGIAAGTATGRAGSA